MKVHLEGFGVVGCACAWALYRRGIEFTWSDINSDVTAWRACTGAVYPSDSCLRDKQGYAGWQRWNAEGYPWVSELSGPVTEFADYWYCTKQAPHGSREKPLTAIGPLKLHRRESIHFNAQTFVERTRATFARLMMPDCPEGSRNVVSHGFNSRLTRYVWGWTQAVRLDTSALPADSLRPAVYLRRGRFLMAYAYPMPGTGLWYAGSTLLVQPSAVGRPIAPDLARWRARFADLSGGLLPVLEEVGEPVQGWRPSSGPVVGEETRPLWTEVGSSLVVLPMWHSGVRWLPLVTDGLLKELTGCS
jgi:hypothetical protein